MSLQRPHRHSPTVASFHHAVKAGATIGTVGGRGISAALDGTAISVFATPIAITLSSVSGAILGGLVRGAGGCALGAQPGETLDHHVRTSTSACPVVIASICRLSRLHFHSHLLMQSVLLQARRLIPACNLRNHVRRAGLLLFHSKSLQPYITPTSQPQASPLNWPVS